MDFRGGAVSAGGKSKTTADQRRDAGVVDSTILKRDPAKLALNTYDVTVIGAGIYGISVARDAALRGLKVALLDRGDVGHATSSNHHRIIHGGLRYLQHADLRRMRESIRERSVLLRIAPHLVRPMPFLIPTYERLLQGKMVMYMALKLNDWLSSDRNRHLHTGQQIPSGRVISRAECIKLCGDLDQPDVTGGALFYDAQVRNPNRLNLALLCSAASAGTQVANYVEVTGFVRDGSAIIGVRAKDRVSGEALMVRSRVVVNCAGPWTEGLLELLAASIKRPPSLCRSMVLVTHPLVTGQVAVGVPSPFVYADKDAIVKKGFRYFFVTPWNNRSLIGTFQTSYTGAPGTLTVSEDEINDAISQFNAAFPKPRLKRTDVVSVFQGLVPGERDDQPGEPQLRKHPEVLDHGNEGIEGLVSVIGVKYTTARAVAEKAVDLIFKKLGRPKPPCHTAEKPINGAGFESSFSGALKIRAARVDPESLQQLIGTHGDRFGEILRYGDADPQWLARIAPDCPVIKAQVLHGVRAEMAQKLGDIVFRRTDLATAGYADERSIYSCAKIMATDMGWGPHRLVREVEEVQQSLAGAMHANN